MGTAGVSEDGNLTSTDHLDWHVARPVADRNRTEGPSVSLSLSLSLALCLSLSSPSLSFSLCVYVYSTCVSGGLDPTGLHVVWKGPGHRIHIHTHPEFDRPGSAHFVT